jgi:hypothetical protein
MKIGVVCEGPTDYPAITHFYSHALQERNITAQFQPLYPELDRTRPQGGWANVLMWLRNNPPATRINRYFGGGLFGGALATEPFDAIIIHLDADILPNDSFKKFVKENYAFEVLDTNDPTVRAKQISDLISISARLVEMSNSDAAKHVAAPAVESTETWCVAAFSMPPQNFEEIRGRNLVNAFMRALEKSEGRTPLIDYENIDKSHHRRIRFCKLHAINSVRVVNGCPSFANSLEKLVSLHIY